MMSGCLDRKEVRGTIWGVHNTTDRPASGNTGRLFHSGTMVVKAGIVTGDTL